MGVRKPWSRYAVSSAIQLSPPASLQSYLAHARYFYITSVWPIRCNISSFSCAPANTIRRFNTAGIKVQCQHDDNRSKPVRIITVHFHRASSPCFYNINTFSAQSTFPIDPASKGPITKHSGMSCIIPSSTMCPSSKYFANQHRTQQALKQHHLL
jgi:hypothetical protein